MTEEINNKSIGADLQNAPKATDDTLRDGEITSHLNEYGNNTNLQFSEEIENTVLTDDQGNEVIDKKTGEVKKVFERFEKMMHDINQLCNPRFFFFSFFH